jgi:hypothetical protein
MHSALDIAAWFLNEVDRIGLKQMRPELLERGIISLPPLPEDHFPADHDEYVRAVSRDLAARPRRQRRVVPARA